jgi:hypothetical protein
MTRQQAGRMAAALEPQLSALQYLLRPRKYFIGRIGKPNALR